jgi:hypothetical protein
VEFIAPDLWNCFHAVKNESFEVICLNLLTIISREVEKNTFFYNEPRGFEIRAGSIRPEQFNISNTWKRSSLQYCQYF